MNKRNFKKSKLEIPEMGMGCWAIGGVGYGPVSESDALQALEAAWNGGVRFFDTADTYGEGRSENLVAQFLKNKKRDEVIVASKGGVDFYQGGHKKNFSPEHIRFACDESLKRLQTDYIDFYQLHNPSLEGIQKGECIRALLELKKSGKIKYAGLSLHKVEEALWVLKNVTEIDSLQVIFNILDQRMRIDVFERAKEKGVAIIAREPLACGLLTGKYDAKTIFPKDDHRRRYSQTKLAADVQKIDKVKQILGARDWGLEVNLSQAALEFVLSEPAVTVVIPGAKNSSQIQQNLKAIREPKLSKDQVQSLRRLFGSDPLFQEYLLPA